MADGKPVSQTLCRPVSNVPQKISSKQNDTPVTNVTLFISVHMINTATQIQLMQNIIAYLLTSVF
jgi:hypothetical protein